MEMEMELGGDAEALEAALSFVDDTFGRYHADLCGEIEGLSPSPVPLPTNAACSDPLIDIPSEFDAFLPYDGNDSALPLTFDSELLDLDVDLEGTDSQLEWETAHPVSVSVGSGSGGDCNNGATESDERSSQTRSPVTGAPIITPNEDPPSISKATAVRRRGSSKKSQKRSAHCNPNRARDEQRKELRRLRLDVSELEEQLRVLQSHRCHLQSFCISSDCGSSTFGTARVGVGGSIASSVWETVAERQLQKRMAATHENTELKSAVQENQLTIMRMAKLLRSHNAEKAAQQFCIERSHRIFQLAQYEMDPRVVQRLVAGVDRCYREVDSVFQHFQSNISSVSGISAPEMREDPAGNLFLRTFGSKILPYSIGATGQVAWSQFAASVRPTARCFVDEIVQASNNVVVSRFATELHMDGSKMAVFGWQVKRYYVEADRVMVVWQSLMDPLEFRDQPLKGASYEEHGFYLIHCPPQIPKGFSLLQTCYRVAPSTPTRTAPQDSTALAVTEFVLNWMAASIPTNHQILEDTLFDRSLTASR